MFYNLRIWKYEDLKMSFCGFAPNVFSYALRFQLFESSIKINSNLLLLKSLQFFGLF